MFDRRARREFWSDGMDGVLYHLMVIGVVLLVCTLVSLIPAAAVILFYRRKVKL